MKLIKSENCVACGCELTNEDFATIYITTLVPYVGNLEQRVMQSCKKCGYKLLTMVENYRKPLQDIFKLFSNEITSKCRSRYRDHEKN